MVLPSLEEVCNRSLYDSYESKQITLKTLKNNLNWVVYEKLFNKIIEKVERTI